MTDEDGPRKRPLISKEVMERFRRKMQDASNPKKPPAGVSREIHEGLPKKNGSVECVSNHTCPKIPPDSIGVTRSTSSAAPSNAVCCVNRVLVVPGKKNRRSTKSNKRAAKRSERKLQAELLRKQNSVLRRNKKLGFTSGFSSADKRRFGSAPPYSGGLCNGK